MSGNKYSRIAVLALCVLMACGPSKRAVKPTPPPVKSDIPKKQETTKLPEKVDTVARKREEAKKPEAKETKPRVEHPSNKTDSKPMERVSILALIPFKSEQLDTLDQKIPYSSLRFVQFYGGMKMALDEFNKSTGRHIEMKVFDTGEQDRTMEILKACETELPDVVLGPYKIESLKQAADWARRNKTILVSPWISSSTITESNPYYIQAKAGLAAHYQLIHDHVRKNFPAENIFIISKNKEESKSHLFNPADSAWPAIREDFISEDDLAKSAEPLLEKYFVAADPAVFILPMVSSRDENYIYHFLRRVSAEKKNHNVYVYGFSKWLELKTDILEYINALNVRLSTSNFVEVDRSEVRSFRYRYFELYREFPGDDAMEGYDLTKYILESLLNQGIGFYQAEPQLSPQYLETRFQLGPVYQTPPATQKELNYYENQYIRLVEIKSNKYRIID
ncbi:MAG TPA: ABC transporter substrate-binding protein [Saprospiraceae bacterium]|nr:ABC transporter substrate-binding protein [Saprospiraceae bacterium]